MGQVTLPTVGRVYCDASIFIYTLESHPIYKPLLIPLWQGVTDGRIEVVTSEMSMMEVLVRPFKTKDVALQGIYLSFLNSTSNVRLSEVTLSVLILAANISALQQVRSPDSIHLATAQLQQANYFLTNDMRLRAKSKISTIVLEDLRQLSS